MLVSTRFNFTLLRIAVASHSLFVQVPSDLAVSSAVFLVTVVRATGARDATDRCRTFLGNLAKPAYIYTRIYGETVSGNGEDITYGKKQ